jgi:undecaprenyl pyrophosphate phosphatase UppP
LIALTVLITLLPIDGNAVTVTFNPGVERSGSTIIDS